MARFPMARTLMEGDPTPWRAMTRALTWTSSRAPSSCVAPTPPVTTRGWLRCASATREGSGDGATCEDVDECTEGTHDCDPAAGKCTNLDGSRACGCQPGWEFAGDGTTACVDIDECAEGGGGCDTAHGECLNTDGSSECGCAKGWLLVGAGSTVCVDTDECTEGEDDCDLLAGTCTNLAGSWACGCQDGWEFVGDGTTACEDVDECALEDDGCDAVNGTCANTDGAYECGCLPGWALAGGGLDRLRRRGRVRHGRPRLRSAARRLHRRGGRLDLVFLAAVVVLSDVTEDGVRAWLEG